MIKDNKLPFLHKLALIIILLMAADVRVLSGISGLVSFTVLEFAVYIGLFSIFMYLVANPFSFRVELRKAIIEFNPVLMFLFFATVGSFLALIGGRSSGLQSLKDLLPSVSLILLLLLVIDNVSKLKKFTKLFLFVGFLSALLGVSQGLFGKPYPFSIDISALGKMGLDGKVLVGNIAVGFFRHPNGLGVYLLPIFVGLFVALFSCLKLIQKSICFFALCFVCIALYYAQAKGAFVWSLIGAFCGVTLLKFGDKFSLWALALLPCFILLIVVFSLESQEQTLSTMQTRYRLWQAAIYVFSDFNFNFFVGSLRDEMYPATYYFTMGKFPYPNAHNAYLNVIVNYGFFAFLAYLLMIKNVFKSSVNVSPDLFTYNSAYKGAFLGLLGLNFFEPTSEGVLIQSQFYILVAAILIVKRLSKGRDFE